MALFSKSIRKELYLRCGGRCPICGKQLQIKNSNILDTYMTIDHIIPKSKNGTNNIENLRPMCRDCNMQKADKDITKNDLVYKNIYGQYIVIQK